MEATDLELQRREERAESISLVRSFSFSLEVANPKNDNVLASALQGEFVRRRDPPKTKTVGFRSWKEFYEEDVNTGQSPEEAKLIFESKALVEAWGLEVEEKKNSKLSKLFPEKPEISMAQLKSLIIGIKDKQKPQGKAHRYLENICNTLDSHSDMISMLPDQSIYASVFCGVFKTLVRASVNHRSIIEVLSRGLMDAGNIVHSCVQRATLVDVAEMRKLIQELYATVFVLMRQALAWYEDKRLKRLLNSFNDKYLDPFKSALDEMRRTADLINTTAVLGHHAETRDTRLMLEQMKDWQEQVREENVKLWERAYEKIEEQNKVLLEIPNREMLGNLVSNLLLESASEIAPALLMYNATRRGTAPENMQWPQLHEQQRESNLEGRATTFSRNAGRGSNSDIILKSDLELYSKSLEDYMATALDPTDIAPGTQLFAEHRIVHAVQQFCQASISQILWINGTPDRRYPSSSSGIAASIINALDEASIPTLHLFLDWPITDEGATISLLYSLIRQTINLLPSEIAATLDCSSQAFSSLDGTLQCWKTGIAILETLLQNMPPLLFLIVDGFEHFDFLSPGEKQVQVLLKLLNKQVLKARSRKNNHGEPERTFKILFTTAGNCALLSGLDEDALTILKTNENQNIRPGQWRAGRAQLSLGDGED